MKGKNSDCDEVVETTSGVTHRDCAMGTKKKKRRIEEEKIADNAATALHGSIQTSNASNSASQAHDIIQRINKINN
jgi:hypothetical protein